MTATLRDRRVAAVIAAFIGAICVYAIRQVDADLYGYLVYGRLFLEHRGPIAVDPFGYTSAGTSWVAFEYLPQMTLAAAYDTLGPFGLIAWKCVLGGLALWCVWLAIRSATDDPVVTLPVLALCAVPIGRYFLFRPQVVTFACFAYFVAVLFRYLVSRRAPLWSLPLVMVVWANSHGGFVAGLGAIGLAALLTLAQQQSERARGDRLSTPVRPLMVTFAVCAAATFVTPFGTNLWRYVLTELTHGTNRQYIAEWQPPRWSSEPWAVAGLVMLALCLLALVWMVRPRSQRVHGLACWQWAAACAPLLVMSAISVRHVPLAAIWTAPVLSILSAAAWTARPSRALAIVWLFVAVTALIPLVVAAQHILQRPAPAIAEGGNLLGNRNPCRIVTAMHERHVAGHVYAPLWWGAYLTWRLYPAVLVSADGRNISAFPRDVVLENLRFFTEPDQDPTVPLRHDTDFLLVPTDAPVLQALRESDRWQEVLEDQDAVLFRRADRPGPLPERSSSGSGACDGVLR